MKKFNFDINIIKSPGSWVIAESEDDAWQKISAKLESLNDDNFQFEPDIEMCDIE